ncbi:MAG: 1-(5-phosphoribosyl)-5-[(5-phosphoribosylamino)methylideneamino] imidazole-4-carboxamide isomerase [Rhizobiales bacterium]|nr:1-(5-phosphoribosyl)-5-[(5-phosphoribosylamino)methylideneamino] imidazole-4-carboxamide isomerase [Hyphomicrobiales bacterium]MBI3673768.1 1-(5-phosphoribosyl)-5-[(5-phosphoribosylamino)methylideneamino] imidazole-4-carboxamide isomerase [Hyphomicrobiales bacterium]
MIIYPDLELRQGRLVNLVRNRIDSPIVYDLDPIEVARDLARQGAEWLHVVDLDAVFNAGENTAIIKEIIRSAGCSVQVGGAIRAMEKVHSWMDAGASRVVIATAAVKYPHFVKAAATAYPDSIVVSIDVRGGLVVIEGWTETTTFTPAEFAHQFDNVGLSSIIYTDIDRDEDHPESSMAHIADLAAKVRTPVIGSGVVKTLDDISTLSYLPNIAGVITSRALFGGAFSFPEAKAIATTRHDPPAPFL